MNVRTVVLGPKISKIFKAGGHIENEASPGLGKPTKKRNSFINKKSCGRTTSANEIEPVVHKLHRDRISEGEIAEGVRRLE